MKKLILLLTICLSAGQAFAQTNPKSFAIYKVDTTQYPANKYRVAAHATVYQLLNKMGDFKFDKDTSLTYQGQQVNMIKLNGKSYVGLDLGLAVMKLGASMIENIEIIDDYGRAANNSFKNLGPDKLLNINIKKERLNDLEQTLLGMNINPNGTGEKMTVIRFSCKDYAGCDVAAAIANLPAVSVESTVDIYGDQIPHFLIKPLPGTWANKAL